MFRFLSLKPTQRIAHPRRDIIGRVNAAAGAALYEFSGMIETENVSRLLSCICEAELLYNTIVANTYIFPLYN